MLASSSLQIMELSNAVQLLALFTLRKMNGGNERFLKEKIEQGPL